MITPPNRRQRLVTKANVPTSRAAEFFERITDKVNNSSDVFGLGTAAVEDVGVQAGNVVQLDGSSRLPPVDGSLLTGVTGLPGPEGPPGTTDHTLLTNIGTNTHPQIDTHIADIDIHFSDAPVDAQDYVRNNNSWVLASAGVTDHTLLSNIGTNTHAQIDAHIANVSNPHAVSLGQITDVTLTGPVLNDVVYFDGSGWANISASVLGGSNNLDGGASDSNYGGILGIDGGNST